MNPYLPLASEYARLTRAGQTHPLGGLLPAPAPILPADAPRALVFSPHPDDECITGGLALRLLRQAGMNVVNVAVTQGSNRARQAERFAELQQACHYLGFGLLATRPGGLEKITAQTRQTDRSGWNASVQVIADLLSREQPRVVFFPHEHDWNGTHIGTHFLVVDALKRQSPQFACFTVETEFWGAMDAPNLMVESSAAEVADLMAALSFHVGEVRRNPYHLRLPAWMQDNVRRGGELVGGQGGAAPDLDFATLYRLRHWRAGAWEPVFTGGRVLSGRDAPGGLFNVSGL
jgi:LmbE family N-acetylglucosaminyl deacetylase